MIIYNVIINNHRKDYHFTCENKAYHFAAFWGGVVELTQINK